MIADMILQVGDHVDSRGINENGPVSGCSIHYFHDSFRWSLNKDFLNHSELAMEIVAWCFRFVSFLAVAHMKNPSLHLIEPLLIHKVG